MIDGIPDAIFLFGREGAGKVYRPSTNTWDEAASLLSSWPQLNLTEIEFVLPVSQARN